MREVYLVYQCPDPDCGLVGLLHDYEFTTGPNSPPEGSWVPCPRCSEPMSELRKAEEKELDNLVRLTRYLQCSPIYTIPMSSLMNPSSTRNESDSRKDLPVKRKAKTSVMALAHELLGAEHVADILGLSVQTVRALWTDGELGYIQYNKKQRMSNKEQIEEYLRSKTAVTALSSPKPTLAAIRNRQFKTPAKVSIEDVRKKLSSWDESSDSDTNTDKE